MDKKPQTKSPSNTNKPTQPGGKPQQQMPGKNSPNSPNAPKKPGSNW